MMIARRQVLRVGIPLVTGLVFGALVLGLGGLRLSYAQTKARTKTKTEASHEVARQVTVFAIVATPGGKTVDTNLTSIQGQLNRLLPGHGFKLRDAQIGRVKAGESVDCDLGNGCTVETSLVQPIDEDGKVKLRCELFLDKSLQFSATVKAPLNQLFFCERPFLDDGSKLLIGVGVR
ncbi:MAG: hypothetical protein ACLQGP_02505 [Isosphaeraceae bacterium]